MKFSKLRASDLFISRDQRGLYVRLDPDSAEHPHPQFPSSTRNALCLNTGKLWCFADHDRVKRLPVALLDHLG